MSAKELKPEEFHVLVDQLEKALFQFESTSNHAVLRLYRRGVGSNLEESMDSLRSAAEENSVLMGSDSENIFLVYLCAFFACRLLHCLILCLVSSSLYKSLQKR